MSAERNVCFMYLKRTQFFSKKLEMIELLESSKCKLKNIIDLQ